MTFSLPGWKVSCYFRSGSECSREQSSTYGTFASGSLLLLGAEVRGIESSVIHRLLIYTRFIHYEEKILSPCLVSNKFLHEIADVK